MNCKDCTHYDVCIESGRIILEFYGEDDAINFCSYFKDKSRFIELSCSIGDTVYTILYHNVFEAEVVCIRPFVFNNHIEYRGNVVITMIDPFYSDWRLLEQELLLYLVKIYF